MPPGFGFSIQNLGATGLHRELRSQGSVQLERKVRSNLIWTGTGTGKVHHLPGGFWCRAPLGCRILSHQPGPRQRPCWTSASSVGAAAGRLPGNNSGPLQKARADPARIRNPPCACACRRPVSRLSKPTARLPDRRIGTLQCIDSGELPCILLLIGGGLCSLPPLGCHVPVLRPGAE
jgi:hypothetical protein